MMRFKVDSVKSQFFDRKSVIDVLDDHALKKFSRFGAFVRRSDRSSQRKARQKTIAELTEDERLRFRIQQREAKEKGLPKPRRPLKHSEPGQPPRTIAGDIKRLTFFAYDPEERSVVIGPALLNSSKTGGGVVPRTVEEGGFVETPNGRFRIDPRPHTKPAFDANLKVLSQP